MRKRGILSTLISVATAALVALAVASPPAGAETAEPVVTATAWYWEEKQSQEVTLPNGSKVTIETPNPFCPEITGGFGAPEQTCAPQRLPVEIRNGDYETPNKLSAVAFDFSLVPPESTVTEFTVTFLEAKRGCYDDDKDGQPDHCEETNPVNIEGKKLQACEVTEIFGEGDGRQYKELPKFSCSGAPLAVRKEVKPKKNDDPEAEPDHTWTFDLTPYAQKWLQSFSVSTAIMITAAPAKEQDQPQDNWRVVLAGPKVKNGVVTFIDYEPPALDPGDPTDTGDPTGTGDVPTDDFTTTGGAPDDFGDTGGGGPTGGDDLPGAEAAGDDEEQASDVADPTKWPWYMWVAILAGLIGFSMVRSVVVEAATGIRPDGVLAQIRQMNAQRKGITAEVAEGTGVLGAIGHGLSRVGSNVSGVVRKLNFLRRG